VWYCAALGSPLGSPYCSYTHTPLLHVTDFGSLVAGCQSSSTEPLEASECYFVQTLLPSSAVSRQRASGGVCL